ERGGGEKCSDAIEHSGAPCSCRRARAMTAPRSGTWSGHRFVRKRPTRKRRSGAEARLRRAMGRISTLAALRSKAKVWGPSPREAGRGWPERTGGRGGGQPVGDGLVAPFPLPRLAASRLGTLSPLRGARESRCARTRSSKWCLCAEADSSVKVHLECQRALSIQ